MLVTLPPTNVSSISTGPLPPSLVEVLSVMTSRIRCSICHALFCVTPIVRAISQEETPLRRFAGIHIATIHLSRPSGESWKMVPTLTENCFLQPRHFHRFWFANQRTLPISPQLEQEISPSGQRIAATSLMQTCSSLKYLTASTRVFGYAMN